MGLSSPELFLLVLASLSYLLQPSWPALQLADVRLRAAIKYSAARRLGGWSDYFNSRKKLIETRGEVDRLKSDLDLSRAELRMLNLQVAENEALRTLFTLPKRAQYRYIYAEVVAREIQAARSRIFVRVHSDVSAAKNISTGAPVIASNAPYWAAVGQVSDTRQTDLIEVMLLSDPRSRIGVAAADSPAFGSALLIGGGWDRLELDYAAHPHFMRFLSPGGRLVTSKESRFPPGFFAAELESSDEAPDGASSRIKAKSAVSLSDMRYVVILIPQDISP